MDLWVTTGWKLSELHQQQPPITNHEWGGAEKGMLPSAPQLVSATALNKACVRPHGINGNDNYNRIQEQRSWRRRQKLCLPSRECPGWLQAVCGAEGTCRGHLFLPCVCTAHVICLSICLFLFLPNQRKGSVLREMGWIQAAMLSLPAGLKGILRCPAVVSLW